MIIDFNKLNKLSRKKTVCLAGSFDIFHSGHVQWLRSVKEKFSKHKLIVAILADDTVKKRKGASRPIRKSKDRLAVVEAIKYVDYVFILPKERKGRRNIIGDVLKRLNPEVMFLAKDRYDYWKSKETNFNTKLLLQPDKNIGESSTAIIEKIKNLTKIKNELK